MPASVIGEMITFPNDHTNVSGYLAKPQAAGRYPAVIVIQEWWGLVPHIKELADRFAGEGYLALAPDLYHGQTATEPDGAMQLARSLAWDSALHDLKASAKYLKSRPDSTGKLGTVGFCMGGGLSYRFAAHSDGPSAAVIFYGSSPSRDRGGGLGLLPRPGPLRRDGHPYHFERARVGRSDEGRRQVIRIPRLPGRAPRLLQRQLAGLYRRRRAGRLAAHPGLLPPAPRLRPRPVNRPRRAARSEQP